MDKTVSIVYCDSYDTENVDRAVHRLFESFGSISSLNLGGKRVLLKVNLLSANKPEDAVTTHPAIVAAVARVLIDAGAEVIIGDSPGGVYTQASLSRVYRVCGMEQAARVSGAKLNYDLSYRRVSFPEGKLAQEFDIISPALDADVIFSVCKLKIHGLSYYTGAVKNLFGTIPGLEKAAFHSRFPNRDRFNSVLVDICQLNKPYFSIIDGVIGMEGDGPSGGDPKFVGVIGASFNPYALDMAMCDLVSLPPSQVPVITEAISRGLIPVKVSSLTFIGDDREQRRTRFRPPASGGRSGPLSILLRHILPKRISNSLQSIWSPWPIITDRCIACKKCVEICPRQIITIENDRAVPDYIGCIRCYCCHEICPVNAIDLLRKLKVPEGSSKW